MTDSEEKISLPVIGRDIPEKKSKPKAVATDDIDFASVQDQVAFSRLPECVRNAYAEMRRANKRKSEADADVQRLDKEIKTLDIHEKLAAKIKQLEAQRHK